MSDKGHLHHSLRGLQKVKTWQLVILLVLAGFVSATFLRLNNVGMVERRNAVISADKAGDADATIQRLYDLQTYVSAHMNTDLGRGVYLESTYSRDLEAWQKAEYGDDNPNGNVFVKAQEVCAPRFSSWSTAYVQCVANELAKYPSADELGADTSRPREETYIYDYESPLWSPDFAGWSLVVVGVIALLIVVRLVALGVLHLMLRRNYTSL